ncbi:MAG: threonine/serine exporter ThrE family protein [Lacticaseibacillus absianus]
MKTETTEQEYRHHLSQHHHMRVQWEEFFKSEDTTKIMDATLIEKSSIITRVGMMILSCGTGAWRVRDAMDTMARTLDLTCSTDIGLVSLECTYFDVNNQSYSQNMALPATGVNMAKLDALERFVRQFEAGEGDFTIKDVRHRLGQIEHIKGQYKLWQVGLAAALACGGFIFLLGGGIPEVICAFLGAGVGQLCRGGLSKRGITFSATTAVGVLAACLTYFLAFSIGSHLFAWPGAHIHGYIGAMLFVIPGFPFITSGLDMAKLDLRSGLERLAYALLIICIATAVGWISATVLGIRPGTMPDLSLEVWQMVLLRLLASFCGVFGFSIMFNSHVKMAAIAGCVGAIANTLRLSMVDYGHVPGPLAAYLAALLAGILASYVRERVGYPRISLTVPSIVIMVPGLYMYRAIYLLANVHVGAGATWMTEALMLVFALPMGLLTARILTDKKWRHVG